MGVPVVCCVSNKHVLLERDVQHANEADLKLVAMISAMGNKPVCRWVFQDNFFHVDAVVKQKGLQVFGDRAIKRKIRVAGD